MKLNHVFSILLLLSFSASSQIKSTYTYAIKNGDSLKLDVYIPETLRESQRFPAFIWMHGGGFAGGSRDVGDELKFMEYLSTHDYVGVSISYRLLLKGKKTGFGCDYPKDQKLHVFKEAALDYLEASKFIFENHSRFKIDKNKVIAGGSSAGAEAVLSAVYMKDFYIENAQDFREVKFAGLISLAGAMVNVNYLNEYNAVPTVLFHGTADTAVPFATAAHHYCKTDQAGYLILDGSETIAKRLKALDTSFYFHVEIDGHHGLSSIPFNSLEAILKFFERTSSSSEIVQTTIIVEADQN